MGKRDLQQDGKTVMTISKQDAVFWMDGQGRWHNQHGPFEHKRLIAYFNASINKDADGYYLTQDRGDFIEKVYFPYEETALFAVDISKSMPLTITLNTGRQLELAAEGLYICEDQLYMDDQGEIIKFSPRALMKISHYIDYRDGVHWFTAGDKRNKIVERGLGDDRQK